MDVVGSKIGQKMRSAIKAKLTELGCYVDDELPDYVMVMVANKRTRSQMEDDLQLFLGDNTKLFVNWLHQVLKKLQEVTVTAPLIPAEVEKVKEKTKEKKSKEKKEKVKKTDSLKKGKKKDKDKSHRKKEDKKAHKSKKKSKHHEMIRPNIPPLLMNIEKESEPSITDVFAGQILKNHGINLETTKVEKQVDEKPIINEPKRPIIPIIDPATITTQPEESSVVTIEEAPSDQPTEEPENVTAIPIAPREDQIKEINEIEAKIQGLKQKLAEQLDSMSDDEDFLNIRTEAEELMNDFAEDVFQEISQQAPVATPPLQSKRTPSPAQPTPKAPEIPKDPPKETPETLPQIELKLPKRPVRERLGAREEIKKVVEVKEKTDKRTESPERFTPEREPDFWGKYKSAKSRLGEQTSVEAPTPKRISVSDDSSDKSDSSTKRVTSRVQALEKRPSRVSCASVVRVRPRPRVSAPASSLLMRAVADAHKSLLNIPPKVDQEPNKVKRALVLPMRRCVDAQKIVIQVPGGDRQPAHDSSADVDSDGDFKMVKAPSSMDKEEYVPAPIIKKIHNTDYVPSRRSERTSSRRDDTLIIETINIHHTTVDKDKNTQFIVTMDGFNPNAFLAKKLLTEGLLEEEEAKEKSKETKSVLKTAETIKESSEKRAKTAEEKEPENTVENSPETKEASSPKKKRLSDASEESDTQVIIKHVDNNNEKRNVDNAEDKRKNSDTGTEKRKSSDVIEKRKSSDAEQRSENREKRTSVEIAKEIAEDKPPVKKRRASPIVFDVKKKEEKRERERTESVSSDNVVTVTTSVNTNKYDAVPPLSQAERKLVWCRSFPLCRYGSACAFQHPRCKFAAACTRRSCVYSHGARAAAPPVAVASHVVPVANYKTISPVALPSVCKYYPSCVNPACHYYHPKPCRYGAACANKLECNFFHNDVASKWKFPV